MTGGYPHPAAWPAARPRPPSGATAETLVLVGLLLQVIGGVLLFAALAFLFGFSVVHPYRLAWLAVTGGAVVAILVALFLYLVYTLCYQRIQRQEYSEARLPTLVLGVLSLFLGVIPGVLYLVGYVQLGDAVREQQAATDGPPGSLIACRGCGRVWPLGPFAFCPGCGQKLGA